MTKSPNLIQTILARLSLRALAEEAGAIFRGAATTPSSACPLHHGDNPGAFHLYAGGQRWHCFTRCPDGKNDGDLIAFFMHWKQLDFAAALRRLAERAGLPISSDLASSTALRSLAGGAGFSPSSDPSVQPRPAGSSLDIPAPPSALWQRRAQACIDYARSQLLERTTGAAVRAYLYSERGLTPDTQEAFQLGYLPRDLFDDPLCWGFHPLPPPIQPPPDPRLAKPASVKPAHAAVGCTNFVGEAALEDSILKGKPVRLYPKKIFIPRGILIPGYQPGYQLNTPWYLKIRRPIPGDLLSEYIPAAAGGKTGAIAKFLSVPGSQPTLFGRHLWLGHPTLLLVEGEFDCMLAWQTVSTLSDGCDLCDVATLGSAANRASLPDLAELTRYQRILAVYDSDPAGDRARAYLSAFSRIKLIPSPAHDLSDYFRGGGNLRKWITSVLNY